MRVLRLRHALPHAATALLLREPQQSRGVVHWPPTPGAHARRGKAPPPPQRAHVGAVSRCVASATAAPPHDARAKAAAGPTILLDVGGMKCAGCSAAVQRILSGECATPATARSHAPNPPHRDGRVCSLSPRAACTRPCADAPGVERAVVNLVTETAAVQLQAAAAGDAAALVAAACDKARAHPLNAR